MLLTSGYAESTGGAAQELEIRVLRKPYGIEDLRSAIGQLLPATTEAA